LSKKTKEKAKKITENIGKNKTLTKKKKW
jgi:hypothetical protein